MLPACLGFHLSMHWHWWLYGLAWHGLLHELSSVYVGVVPKYSVALWLRIIP